jgi:DNA polymerase-1
MADSRLFLLDGMALVYRAHFAFIRNPITNSKGVNTSAIYGFANTLLTIIEKEKPTHLAVAFDTSAPTPRHELYPEYKAQREAMPEELAAAIPEVKKLCAAFRIPVLVIDGYEADDIIGTVARRAEETGTIDTFMVTPDKDFAQLVAPRTAMWKPGRQGSDHEILDLPKILANWEIESPKQVIDILGLWGDASDNIPGVPGIGEKTAKKLVARFGSVEGLIENTDQLKGKQKENVINFSDQAKLSKELATIITDVPVEETFDDFLLEDPDSEILKSLFEDWEFRTLTKRLFGDNEGNAESPAAPVFESLKTLGDIAHDYHLVDLPEDLDALLASLLEADTFCFDVETNSLDRFSSRLVGLAFSTKPNEAFYLPVTDWPSLREKLHPVFSSQALKVGHNLKFDLAILRSHDLIVEGPFFDTMLAHTLIAPDQKHSMDSLAENLLNYSPIKLVDLFTKEEPEDDLFAAAAKKKAAKGELDPLELSTETLAEYAAEDADITLQLYHHLLPQLKELNLLHVMEDIEAPLLPVLVAMEAEGITLDQTILDEVGRVLAEKIESLSTEIEEAAGRPFNLNSPKQLGEILFGEMKLVEKPKKTKTGQFKTDEQTLSSLAPKHPIVANILSYREATKLKSTYVDALPAHRSEHSGRVHTHLHQLVTATGRLASSDPNLQNIPVRSEMGRELRRAFTPRGPEFTLMVADYSQIELRVMAALSGDPAMIEAFRNDLDIHTATAARVFGVAPEDVVSEMRRTAKMVNFGIIYGISAFGLSQRLGIPRTEAGEIIDTYFEQYPAIHQFMEDTTESVREKGSAQTLTGRRRYFKDIKSGNASIRANAERAAINSPIQGTAADMIKIAMVRIHQLLKDRKTKMILQVHDELLFDLHQDDRDDLPAIITDAMSGAIALPHHVPVKIDTGFGDNWLQAH